MSVYRPKNSPHYHFDFVFKGDRFCGSCCTASRREAEKIEDERRAEVKAEYERTKRSAHAALTIDAAFLRYWEEVGSTTSAPIKRCGRSKLRMVQKLLRHSDIATTARYAHVLDEDLRDALDRMTTRNPEESPDGSPNPLTKKE